MLLNANKRLKDHWCIAGIAFVSTLRSSWNNRTLVTTAYFLKHAGTQTYSICSAVALISESQQIHAT